MFQPANSISGAAAGVNAPARTLRSQPLSIDGVSKRFGAITALKDLSLEVRAGELVALLGPSGCGKTTTLRLIAGFEYPDTGAISIAGRDVTRVPPNLRGLGMVFQNYSLFPHLTVAENIAFGLRMARVPKAEQAASVARMLDLIRLPGFGDRRIAQMSGGQQQRVALARAIVTNPSVLLLDEPLGALDKNLREGMQFELKSLQNELGVTSVMVTHDQEEALTMSDRVVVMHHGRILQAGTPRDVYDRPRTRFVAEFLGAANILPFTVTHGEHGWLDIAIGAPGAVNRPTCRVAHALPAPLAAGARGELAVRPEKLRFGSARDGEIAFDGVIAARVFRGSQHAYRVEVASLGQTFGVYEQANSAAAYEPGHAVTLAIGQDDLVVLEAEPEHSA
ncbi:ABC transporter ATP-binding protein [Pandoraea communis]|uniref:Spermidine/putrescine import ATP-binding protein PotA n=1 Tax=Pandoraea communis TaxID=2508297 RepID=A0A5E4V2S8_9BURK|nr:ABC transporter ATP-binding protein [Pandoraea communis]MDM8356153.1 ABC transporter ATP-binding protein [Pandoraea communis]VVE06582.1 spermidine/putrescine ABC transporter ATPase [Pandoraea communis]